MDIRQIEFLVDKKDSLCVNETLFCNAEACFKMLKHSP